jgi:hypothetical protein
MVEEGTGWERAHDLAEREVREKANIAFKGEIGRGVRLLIVRLWVRSPLLFIF